MKRIAIAIVICALAGFVSPVNAFSHNRERARAEVLKNSRGFYKDVFMDGGIAVTSRHFLPATRFMGMSMDYYASSLTKNLSAKDTLMQKNIFCGSEKDSNGWLLYPDGAPRFRLIYVNGGKAGTHARSLTEEGRENLRKYVAAGGSYIGTCAGAYLATAGTIRSTGKVRNADVYLGVWPGYAHPTRLSKSKTAMAIERKSPLWRYFDFGKDKQVLDVRHNGGCYAYDGAEKPLPKGTEVLSRYIFINTSKVKIDGEMSAWAYKDSEQSGRVVMCGSHPESIAQGERLEYMSAMMLYAMDGNPTPKIKGVLEPNVVREMNKRTEDNDPDFTRVGDRQYHHFAIDVPKRCKCAIISLEGYEGENRFDLTVCAKRGELAFHDNTLTKIVSRGCKKQLKIEKPKAGRWYVSVLCETTVTALVGKYGTRYTGRVGVLNGVPYKISVKYE
ncbi:MAG: hypothetical protein E7141_02815 [Rikenellaceae bacterium]|nr:hypothetical protein [Rikenellaceae bacterium]